MPLTTNSYVANAPFMEGLGAIPRAFQFPCRADLSRVAELADSLMISSPSPIDSQGIGKFAEWRGISYRSPIPSLVGVGNGNRWHEFPTHFHWETPSRHMRLRLLMVHHAM